MRPIKWKSYFALSLIALLFLVGIGAVILTHPFHSSTCDFSDAVKHAPLDLTLYCPAAQKLPTGIIADTGKASTSGNVVLYPIRDGNTVLSASLQAKPPKEQLANFVANIIPLHFDVTTAVGKGYIGVTNQGQSLLDLPTNSSTWILVSGPKNYDANRLSQIAKAFTAD